MTETLWTIVDAEARHDWLDDRKAFARDEQPDPAEYADLDRRNP